jgi:hypothetical protein
MKVARATRAKMMPIRSQVFFAGGEARVKERRRKMAERRANSAATDGEIRSGVRKSIKILIRSHFDPPDVRFEKDVPRRWPEYSRSSLIRTIP